jgi:GT2 family glycosyltransferase
MRNAAKWVDDLCASLEAQSLGRDRFEVALVDDGSTDDTAERAERWAAADPERRRLVRAGGGGPARARNLGAAATTGDWLAFADSDVLPDARWLEEALAAAERERADVVEGRVELVEGGTPTWWSHQLESLTGGVYVTANMLYRRELFERLGGFDEAFAAAFLEDSDLAFRALDAGARIPFAAGAIVRHRIVERSFAAHLRAARRARWFALLARKHPQRYRTQLRPAIAPLSSRQVDLALGAAGLATIRSARGGARLVLPAASANHLRRALWGAMGLPAPPLEAARRATVVAVGTVLWTFWWLEGCLRFRYLAY